MHDGDPTLVNDNLVEMKNYIEDYTLVSVQLSANIPFIMVMEINTEKNSCMQRKTDGTWVI